MRDAGEDQMWIDRWAISYPVAQMSVAPAGQSIGEWQAGLRTAFERIRGNYVAVVAHGAGASAFLAWLYQADILIRKKIANIILVPQRPDIFPDDAEHASNASAVPAVPRCLLPEHGGVPYGWAQNEAVTWPKAAPVGSAFGQFERHARRLAVGYEADAGNVAGVNACLIRFRLAGFAKENAVWNRLQTAFPFKQELTGCPTRYAIRGAATQPRPTNWSPTVSNADVFAAHTVADASAGTDSVAGQLWRGVSSRMLASFSLGWLSQSFACQNPSISKWAGLFNFRVGLGWQRIKLMRTYWPSIVVGLSLRLMIFAEFQAPPFHSSLDCGCCLPSASIHGIRLLASGTPKLAFRIVFAVQEIRYFAVVVEHIALTWCTGFVRHRREPRPYRWWVRACFQRLRQKQR